MSDPVANAAEHEHTSPSPATLPGPARHDHLEQTADDERQEVMRQWRMAENGVTDARITKLDAPDDPVAYTMLEAADQAMSRGDWQRGVNIFRLVVRDYRQSREAALARTVNDRLASRGSNDR